MSHGPHSMAEYRPDAILYDDCAECDSRAEKGLDGLLHLDAHNFAEAWNRMVDIEHEEQQNGYRSKNEAKLLGNLYTVALLIERHGYRSPWQPFAAVFGGGVS